MAIKLETHKQWRKYIQLNAEINVLKRMKNVPHFPKIIDSGKFNETDNYMAIELLGPNLLELLNTTKKNRF